MKALKILSIITLSLLSNVVVSQDTIYVYQKIGGILKIPTNNVDSIIFYDTTSISLSSDSTFIIPSTYNFENVSYGGQTDRLKMLLALTSYVKTSHYGDKLDETILNNMFANENYTWSGYDFTEQPTKDLKSKTEEDARAEIVALFSDMAANSGDLNSVASDGVAGLVPRGSGHILVDSKGKEYAQLIDKGLMGSCFYYQATSKYLTDDKIGDVVDNETVKEGRGTDKEHHFDEAFGYFGVPIDFPTNIDGLMFWGKYCNKRDELLGTNLIMDEFLKGRAAISAKAKEGQDSAVAEIKRLWEKVAAGNAIHYLNDGLANLADDGQRLHFLTEAYAFIRALQYNSFGNIDASDVQDILTALGDNFWTVTEEEIEYARDLLAAKAGLESVKTDL